MLTLFNIFNYLNVDYNLYICSKIFFINFKICCKMKTKKLNLSVTLNGNTIQRDVVSIDSLVGVLGLLQDRDSMTINCIEIEVSGQK